MMTEITANAGRYSVNRFVEYLRQEELFVALPTEVVVY